MKMVRLLSGQPQTLHWRVYPSELHTHPSELCSSPGNMENTIGTTRWRREHREHNRDYKMDEGTGRTQ